jgi:hypothetical protein
MAIAESKRLALGFPVLIRIFAQAAIGQGARDPAFSIASVKRVTQFTRPALREDERGVKYTYIPLSRVLLKVCGIQQYQFSDPLG